MFILFIFTLLLLLLYGYLIYFYSKAWTEIPVIECVEEIKLQELVKVSVIIPARNEEGNISQCLSALKSQVYPASHLEVIVVNDHSTDKTEEVARSFTNETFRLINLHEYPEMNTGTAYKKKALELGISKSSGELIVTTDADCVAGPQWIQQMVCCYVVQHPVFIAAPVKIHPENSVLSRFQSLDFLTLQGITGASVFKNFHNMCNGANLAYQRKVFYEVGGFEGIDDIASGDDMLLMQKINSRYPGRLTFLKNKDAIVTTKAAANWSAFINQRIRWASKAGKYKDPKISGVLLLVYLLNVLMVVFLTAGFFEPVYFLYFLGLLLLKTLAEFRFTKNVARFFDLQQLMGYFPVFQPLHIIYTVIAGCLGMFGTYRWKERKVT